MPHIRYSRRYSVGLLITAVAIIAIGIALRPKEKRPPNPISEMESARLQRLAQERRLQELGDYISYAAQNAAKGLIYLPQLEQTAVALDARTAATGLRRIVRPALRAVSGSGAQLDLSVQARRPDVPVLLLRSGGESFLPASPRAVVDTGDWVVAVALRSDGAPVFAYGLYENSVDSRCGPLTYTRLRASIPLTNVFIGGGLFSLGGGLAGIIARCEGEIVVLSEASVAVALSRPVPPNDWLQDRYGLRLEAGDGPGLQVITVWNTSPAGKADIAPGDHILEIDGAAISSVAEAVSSLDAEGDHSITLRRGRRTIRTQIALLPPPEEVHVPEAGMVLIDSPEGVLVRSVAENGLAATAGVLPGDIIRRLAGVATTSAGSVAAALSRTGEAVLLSVDRNGSLFDARLAP
jgi:hypothetical protein